MEEHDQSNDLLSDQSHLKILLVETKVASPS